MNVEALFKFSYGLYVVTSQAEEKKSGYIGNTVFQVTSDPLQLAISCNRDNYTADIIKESGRFGVSILEQDTKSTIIGTFGYKSGRDVDKFSDVDYFTTENGTPIVKENSVAWFDCKVVKTVEVDSHILFIGEVVDGDLLQKEKTPLTYAYFHEVKKGISPKNAPTYIDKSKIKD